MGYRRRYKRRRKVRPPKHGSSGVNPCGPGMHMMPDGSCMGGAYHGVSSSNREGGAVMNTSRMATRGQGGGQQYSSELPNTNVRNVNNRRK